MKCRICENDQNNQTFKVKEMLFGTQETFTYFECSYCGCLQISEIPEDMSKYYLQNYYLSSQPRLKRNILKEKILKTYIIPIRRIIGIFIPNFLPSYLYNWLKNTHVNFNSRILEVGCGRGNLLLTLHKYGFNNVLGVDPYIDEEIINKYVKILKSTIHELPDNQKFDLIIFDHSFEHIPDQLKTLVKVSRILSDNGVCLIRLPVKTESIWNQYGINWVQIDAPRHFFIHTLKSFELLVKKSGSIIQDVIFDSTEFQFWGSEQYRRDISLRSENSYLVNPKKSTFTKKQIRRFKEKAKELNIDKQGDQAAFYLVRSEK